MHSTLHFNNLLKTLNLSKTEVNGRPNPNNLKEIHRLR